MKLGIILNTNVPETAWNALRLGRKALEAENEVGLFLLGSGVEIENIQDRVFDVADALASFLDGGGKLLACGTCLKVRHQKTDVCPVSTMAQLVALISDADKVITLG
ncbi:MAG: DsrE family protein [Chloroflexi bacterium]|nr:DsrE family protein [Chloroflexota bacterium]